MQVTNEDVRSFERDVKKYCARYARAVRRSHLVASTMLFEDDDDLHAEVRLKAALALDHARAKGLPAKACVPFVRTAIKHYLLSLIRKSGAQERRLSSTTVGSAFVGDDVMFASHVVRRDAATESQTGSRESLRALPVYVPREGAMRTPEDDLLAVESRRIARAQVDLLREKVGRAKIQALADRVLEDAPLPTGLTSARTAVNRLRRIKVQARKVLEENPQPHLKETALSDFVKPEALPVETLARSIIVLTTMPQGTDLDRIARVYGVERRGRSDDAVRGDVQALALPAGILERKDALVQQIGALNRDAISGEVIDFPWCFSQEFSPKDDACASECDFRAECAASHPKHRVAYVEDRLVQILRAPKPAPTPEVKAPKKATPPKIKASVVTAKEDAAKEVEFPLAKPVDVALDAKTGDVVVSQPPPAVGNVYRENIKHGAEWACVGLTSKGAVLERANGSKGKAKKKRTVSTSKLGTTDRGAFTFVRRKAAPLAPVAPRSEAARAVDAIVEERFRPLSARRAVFRAGQRGYRLREDGSRWTRSPQGSALALANLPVGSVVQRAWEGKVYRAKKIRDGRVTQGKAVTGEVVERKRDGVWRLIDVREYDAAKKKVGASISTSKLIGFEGSLTQIAFAITKTNVWSGAKFFGVLPPELDRKSDAFDPKSWQGGSLYRFRGGDKAAEAR